MAPGLKLEPKALPAAFAVPAGRNPSSGRSAGSSPESIKPFRTSFNVPSPPIAMILLDASSSLARELRCFSAPRGRQKFHTSGSAESGPEKVRPSYPPSPPGGRVHDEGV